ITNRWVLIQIEQIMLKTTTSDSNNTYSRSTFEVGNGGFDKVGTKIHIPGLECSQQSFTAGYHFDKDGINLGTATEVVVVSLQGDVIALHPFFNKVSAGSYRLPQEVTVIESLTFKDVLGNQARANVARHGKQGGPRRIELFEFHDGCYIIRSFDA